MKSTFWGLVGMLLLVGIQRIPAQADPDLSAMIQAIEQAQLNAFKLQQAFVQEGYETDAEFNARKVVALAHSNAPEAVTLRSAISALERTAFIVMPDKVTVQAQPFNRDAKSWTFTIVSQDDTIPYRGNVVRSIAGKSDMKAAFDPVDGAIKAGPLAVSIEYKVRALGGGRYQVYGLYACFTSEEVEMFAVPLEGTLTFVAGAIDRPVFDRPILPTIARLRGSETGNSYEMSLDATMGTGGRSLYEPIWLYMPLPYELPNAIYTAIPGLASLPGTAAQRREQFAKVYESIGGTWRLRKGPLPGSQPAYEARPPIWIMLDDAGYDLDMAEYKTMNRLREISIQFVISPYRSDRGVTLESIQVERSSGIAAIDDAVVYAFSKAQFSNSGDKSIKGRLTYHF